MEAIELCTECVTSNAATKLDFVAKAGIHKQVFCSTSNFVDNSSTEMAVLQTRQPGCSWVVLRQSVICCLTYMHMGDAPASQLTSYHCCTCTETRTVIVL